MTAQRFITFGLLLLVLGYMSRVNTLTERMDRQQLDLADLKGRISSMEAHQ